MPAEYSLMLRDRRTEVAAGTQSFTTTIDVPQVDSVNTAACGHLTMNQEEDEKHSLGSSK